MEPSRQRSRAIIVAEARGSFAGVRRAKAVWQFAKLCWQLWLSDSVTEVCASTRHLTPSRCFRRSTRRLVTSACVAAGLNFNAIVAVGEIIEDDFLNIDSHLKSSERAGRLTKDVVRFLQELFADRLLLWRSTDGRSAGWRERGDVGYSDPLVLDNRTYRTYLWSGPLSVWQAIPTIFARGRIRDDREYEILATLLENEGPDAFEGAERDLASRLAADYKRERAV
jgi:hypothetical protein